LGSQLKASFRSLSLSSGGLTGLFRRWDSIYNPLLAADEERKQQ
jgi:hypothetical protein